jgi:23S rRNA pseudouridine1911/1915/1917 synthase
LFFLGHPIAGDKKYGAKTNPLGRLALHAETLSFYHPFDGRLMEFSSPAFSGFKKIP